MKRIVMNWDVTSVSSYTAPTFLEGDLGVANMVIYLTKLPQDFDGRVRATFCNSSDSDNVYVIEEKIEDSKTEFPVPDEVLRMDGRVCCRLIIRNTDRTKILGNVEEVCFLVVKKDDWELIEPLIPDSSGVSVGDLTDELYDILKNSKDELREYSEHLKNTMGQYKTLTIKEALNIIKKYKGDVA